MSSLVCNVAVANVRRFAPNAVDNRGRGRDASFAQTLKRTLVAEFTNGVPENEREEFRKSLEWSWSNLWRPTFVPDLWYIDAEERDIFVYEIEDTCPLTSLKLAKLVDFWWSMDNEGWDVHLTAFDRYGFNARRINLQRAAFVHMGAEINSPGYQAAIEFLRLSPDDDFGAN
jgi:hypothetical protein